MTDCEISLFIDKIDACNFSIYDYISANVSDMSILIIACLYSFRDDNSKLLVDARIVERLNNIDWNNITCYFELRNYILPLFLDLSEGDKLYLIIKDKWLDEILPVILKSLNDIEQLNEVNELCVRFGCNLSKIYTHGFQSMIDSSIMNIYMTKVENIKEKELLNIYSEDQYQELESQIWNSYSSIYNDLLGIHQELAEDIALSLFKDIDIEDIIERNQAEEAMIDSYLDSGYDFIRTPSEESIIDNLFSSMDKE